jgi:myo-inositol-1-phosphate synthase
LAPTPRRKPAARSSRRVGVWLFGAYGGLATTVVVGARAMARGLAAPRGLLTATQLARGVPFAPLDSLVFGGHEVRSSDYESSAREIDAADGTLPPRLVDALRQDLRAASRNVVRGVLPNPGRTIDSIVEHGAGDRQPLRAQVARIQRDIASFQRRHRLDRVVCVNVTSTEPPLQLGSAHRSVDAFRRALARNDVRAVRPSTIYAWAAADLGLPLIHFTPSNGAFVAAVRERFAQTGAPYMGSDGKTGETLVKSALAPMFKHRDLRVLTWQGYNILGDRDGRVLADADNKRAKVASKDALLPQILGYPLHTHVGIDYVPSLHDHKTAWDFIHFEGFLGHRMAMQFIWQGCDAILAAPLVLDLVRCADLAAAAGEAGPMHPLACFFKQPLDTAEHDLHRQAEQFAAWLERHRRREQEVAPRAGFRARSPSPRRRTP